MNRDFNKVIRLGVYGLVLLGAACSQSSVDSSAEETAVSRETTQQSHGNDATKSATGEIMDQQISDAVTDLATRIGIEGDSIKVSQARAVSWGSSALGCPEEGMNYTQAIVPGVLLILEVDRSYYRYHGRTGSSLFYCPKDRAIAPAYGPGKELR